jgi:hypothetical protein
MTITHTHQLIHFSRACRVGPQTVKIPAKILKDL